MSRITIEDTIPGYLAREGSINLQIRTQSGVEASAVYSAQQDTWTVFLPGASIPATITRTGGEQYDRAGMEELLLRSIRNAMLADLIDLSELPYDMPPPSVQAAPAPRKLRSGKGRANRADYEDLRRHDALGLND